MVRAGLTTRPCAVAVPPWHDVLPGRRRAGKRGAGLYRAENGGGEWLGRSHGQRRPDRRADAPRLAGNRQPGARADLPQLPAGVAELRRPHLALRTTTLIQPI